MIAKILKKKILVRVPTIWHNTTNAVGLVGAQMCTNCFVYLFYVDIDTLWLWTFTPVYFFQNK